MNIQDTQEKILLFQQKIENTKILLPINKKMNERISPNEISSFEQEYKISLPKEYKLFLLNIGNGGIGPDYGLLSLQDSIWDTKLKNSSKIKITSPFLYTDSWNENWIADLDWDNGERPDDAKLNEYMDVKHISGCLQIGHIGHGCTYLLVVNGQEYGNIWIDDRADYGGLNPVLSKNGQRVNFAEWYIDWLNEELEKQ